jgi:hypothetical protein
MPEGINAAVGWFAWTLRALPAQAKHASTRTIVCMIGNFWQNWDQFCSQRSTMLNQALKPKNV